MAPEIACLCIKYEWLGWVNIRTALINLIINRGQFFEMLIRLKTEQNFLNWWCVALAGSGETELK